MDAGVNWDKMIGDAVALGVEGYTCSQAVAGAFSGLLGVDEKLLFRMSSPFAGGMLSGNVCGVAGAGLLLLGALFGPESLKDADRKRRIVFLGSEFMDRFVKVNGSMLCAELWTGADIRTPEGAKECRLSGKPEQIIRSGAEILAAILKREGAQP